MKPKFHFLFLVVAFLIFTIGKANAQGVGNHITMSLENCTQISSDTIEFDLMVTSDGTSSSDLRPNTLSWGVNFNTAILQSGATITATNIGPNLNVDPIFSSKNYTFAPSSFPDHIRLTQSPCTGCNYGAKGTVNVSGTTVTWVSGEAFVCSGCTRFNGNDPWVGQLIRINGVTYIIASVTDDTHLVLTTSAGTQTGVSFSAFSMIIGQKYRAGRILLTSSSNFVSGNNPNFSLQNVVAGGKTNTVAIAYADSLGSTTSFSVSGTGNGQRSVSVNCNSCSYSTSVNYSDESCSGAADGSIAVNVKSATPPISYLWSTGATASSISNLSTGNYIVTVADSSGCSSVRVIRINEKSPYCKYNTVKGVCFIDYNNNGVKDAGEPGYNGSMIISQGGAINYSSQPDAQGVFNNYVDSGTSVTSLQNLMPYYTCTPVQYTSNFSSYFNTDSVNFALVPVPGYQDLRISLVNTHRGRPGTWTNFNISYTNVGVTIVPSGSVYLVKDHRLNIGTVTPNYSSVSGDTITWLYSNLIPNETRKITIQLPIPTPPTMNVGDTMISSAVIEPIPSDVVPSDNYSATNITVVGSMDPNDKTMMLGTQFTTTQVNNGDYFNYVIRFQNTGTDTAFKVVICDTLDNKLDGSTFEMISSSHNYTVGIEDQKNITWTFDNILLVDSNHNEPASHGYVAYRIKPKNSVVDGDLIKNTASIFFDYNLPVVTNTSVTTIIFPNAVPDIANLASGIKLFPNPSNGNVTISYSLSKTSKVKIEIYDSFGQQIKALANGLQTSGKQEIIFDSEKLAAGIYFIKMSVDGNTTTIKMVKM